MPACWTCARQPPHAADRTEAAPSIYHRNCRQREFRSGVVKNQPLHVELLVRRWTSSQHCLPSYLANRRAHDSLAKTITRLVRGPDLGNAESGVGLRAQVHQPVRGRLISVRFQLLKHLVVHRDRLRDVHMKPVHTFTNQSSRERERVSGGNNTPGAVTRSRDEWDNSPTNPTFELRRLRQRRCQCSPTETPTRTMTEPNHHNPPSVGGDGPRPGHKNEPRRPTPTRFFWVATTQRPASRPFPSPRAEKIGLETCS
jgi:hypothetical protein